MASITRPVSLIQPSPTSPVDHLLPVRQSLSPPGPGHYTLRRFSYISERPPEEERAPSRRHSLLRAPSFTSMGFGFKEKAVPSAAVQPVSPMMSTPSSAFRSKERPTSSHGLFSMHKPKGMKKKRSLASLLSEPAAVEADQTPSRSSRTHSSSDAASSFHLAPPAASSSSAAKAKALRATEQDLRKEEYRQLQLQPPKPKSPSVKAKKTVWSKRHNMKVHTLQSQAVYMQAYDPVLLENDRYFDLLLRQLNPLENPSFHDYGRKVPFYVLDLGCGSGHWILEAATYWNQSSITGLDMVDILIPEARNHDNIHFVQGNFLRCPWPFPDKSFDLVRMANLSLCIPYDKWEPLLAEVHRVLTIDGRLELIDDQIFFPYRPQPASRPASLCLPTFDPPILDKGCSFFQTDDDGEEEENDAASVKSQSTLIGDGDTLAPLQKIGKALSISNPDASNSPMLTLQALDDLKTPNSAATIKPADVPRPSEWTLEANACRDLEIVFENMLLKKYRVHARPSKFIPDVMQHVFGNGEKLRTYHLKLAPKGAAVEYGSTSGMGSSEGHEREEQPGSESKKVNHGIAKSWLKSDVDKEEKKRLRKLNKASTPTMDSSFLSPDTRIPEGLNAKAAGRLGIREHTIPKAVSRIPENVSAKAAHRLGIPMVGELKTEEPAKSGSPTPQTNANKSAAPSPTPPLTPTAATGPPVTARASQDSTTGSAAESRLSAKAAHRLGISYSALTEAAASAKESSRRPQSSSSTLVNFTAPFQSPGLIVEPSTFIPLSPTELEMHACKYVHTLIGCKPALAEYVSSFLDENGNRIESEEDFDNAMWDYECFRRRRFNWPSEIPDSWETDPDTDAPETAPTTRSGDTPKPATFRNSIIADSSLAPNDASESRAHRHDDLTHVRTLRVYEAVKRGDYTLSTLPFPRSPPPSPPR
ncbi:putative ubiE/COQ5 methyltransferase family protein [Lyophyllum shimeji]|uniref:UbiE/COQ5 methyltransferase family protein n=1 Tax=Lyophyllum shimeji TaxID=47721 RepID=A0A9P3UQ43_LYOSH|nr:putative ubiE/COQ5 methyltransferase family protein [Lyophyllum shimeji]